MRRAWLALLLGVSAVAWGQDGAATLAADPSTAVVLELVRGLGLPGVLVWLAWTLGRSGGIPVQVRLAPEDRALLRGRNEP